MNLSVAVDDLRKNPRQWQAFTTEGHCVVLAPPGSGKTKLLSTRVAFDLANRIPRPHGAACITLTNAAADELRQRIEAIGASRRSTLFIDTVHSFAYSRIVLPFANLVGRPDLAHRSIASKAQTRAAMSAAIVNVPGASNDRYIESTINVLRNRFATDAEWALAGNNVREVARRYGTLLDSSNLIDFTGIIEHAVAFVEENQSVRKILNALYPHIYVDEYQDLAPGLDRLVRALCFDYFNSSELFAVGDPDQAVFGFNGAKPELLHDLANRTGVTPVELELSYRCGVEIVRVAGFMKRSESRVIGIREGGSVSTNYCPAGFAAQCSLAADHAEELRQRGVPLSEIVVIAPTNDQCELAAATLRQRGLSVLFRRDQDYRLNALTVFIEGCVVWSVLEREQGGYRLADIQRKWRSLLGKFWDRSYGVELTRLLLEYSGRTDEPAYNFIDALKSAGLGLALKREQIANDAPELDNMVEALTSGRLRAISVQAFAERVRKTDCIEVTTMTSSKGLEFDHALILGMDQGRVPHFNSKKNPREMEEDRRKFYVSLTRARYSVEIFYSGFVEWPKSRSNDGPSLFLTETGLLGPSRTISLSGLSTKAVTERS